MLTTRQNENIYPYQLMSKMNKSDAITIVIFVQKVRRPSTWSNMCQQGISQIRTQTHTRLQWSGAQATQ